MQDSRDRPLDLFLLWAASPRGCRDTLCAFLQNLTAYSRRILMQADVGALHCAGWEIERFRLSAASIDSQAILFGEKNNE
jgi:hypothetical protein